jgi:serine/threonine protein kinase
MVVLKSLNNSRNITEKFLHEVTCHKLFEDSFEKLVTTCYGISQDPATKNYLMVIDYIKGGSLRKYLNENYIKLDFESKLGQLRYIADGLWNIHDQG